MRLGPLVVGLASVSVLTVGACQDDDPSSSALVPGETHSNPAGPDDETDNSWQEVARQELPYPEVNNLRMDGTKVVFAYSKRRAKVDSVGVLDWETGEVENLYSTQFPRGKVDWVAVEDGWALFADEDRISWVGDEGTKWRLYAMPLDGSKAPTELSRSPGDVRSWPAVPVAGNGSFVWMELEDPQDPRQGLRVRSWAIGDAQPHDELRSAKIDGLPAPSKSGLVFAAPSGRHSAALLGSDLFLLPPGDDTPTQLTDRGRVVDFDVDGDVIAWTEQREPGTDSTGDPFAPHTVHMAELSGSWQERVVHEGPNQGNATAGSLGFAVFWRGERPAIAWPTQDSPAMIRGPRTWTPARLDASGDLFTYATRGNDRVTVHVVRVTHTDAERE